MISLMYGLNRSTGGNASMGNVPARRLFIHILALSSCKMFRMRASAGEISVNMMSTITLKNLLLVYSAQFHYDFWLLEAVVLFCSYSKCQYD